MGSLIGISVIVLSLLALVIAIALCIKELYGEIGALREKFDSVLKRLGGKR